MAYIYRHITSENILFYIGIGSDNKYNSLVEASKILQKSIGNISNIFLQKSTKPDQD